MKLQFRGLQFKSPAEALSAWSARKVWELAEVGLFVVALAGFWTTGISQVQFWLTGLAGIFALRILRSLFYRSAGLHGVFFDLPLLIATSGLLLAIILQTNGSELQSFGSGGFWAVGMLLLGAAYTYITALLTAENPFFRAVWRLLPLWALLTVLFVAQLTVLSWGVVVLWLFTRARLPLFSRVVALILTVLLIATQTIPAIQAPIWLFALAAALLVVRAYHGHLSRRSLGAWMFPLLLAASALLLLLAHEPARQTLQLFAQRVWPQGLSASEWLFGLGPSFATGTLTGVILGYGLLGLLSIFIWLALLLLKLRAQARLANVSGAAIPRMLPLSLAVWAFLGVALCFGLLPTFGLLLVAIVQGVLLGNLLRHEATWVGRDLSQATPAIWKRVLANDVSEEVLVALRLILVVAVILYLPQIVQAAVQLFYL